MMVYFSGRTNTEKVHTVQMPSKDMILASEFFSDLARKNFELLASLASALKILIPPLYYTFQIESFQAGHVRQVLSDNKHLPC
jgi:hypothetical protein